jgi:hypothetical protein
LLNSNDSHIRNVAGDVLDQPNIALLLSPGHREDLKRIEKETGCILEINCRHATLSVLLVGKLTNNQLLLLSWAKNTLNLSFVQ